MSYDPNLPKSPPPSGDGGNRALYFIVGGLVVLAAVFVFIFTNNDNGGGSATDANAPAATTEPAAPAPAPAPAPADNTGGTTTNQ
jgi:hypothetical protein